MSIQLNFIDSVTPLKVSVLITLERGPGSGGHVKSWERLAEAAAQRPDRIDLTLHFLAENRAVESVSANVRFVTHKPAFGTRNLRFLDQGAGHTDLARRHPGLLPYLRDADVVHATDFFSFGRTALSYAGKFGYGLTASVQTDVPRFTEIYAGDVLQRMFGRRIGMVLVERAQLPERIARGMARRLDRLLERCDRALLSKPEDRSRMATAMPTANIAPFRRGIDRERFHPRHRDRARMEQRFGIPADRIVLLFVGRVDASKSAPLMAEAAARLIAEGRNVHALVVGDGQERDRIGAQLAHRANLPGNVTQAELAWLYASSDVFVFPSATEVSPNVVLEAKASGLPVVVAAEHGGGQFVARPGIDGIVISTRDPASWTDAIRPMIEDHRHRAEIGRQARAWVERAWPDWSEVLEQDLLVAWGDAARNGRYRHVNHTRHRPGG